MFRHDPQAPNSHHSSPSHSHTPASSSLVGLLFSYPGTQLSFTSTFAHPLRSASPPFLLLSVRFLLILTSV